MKKLLGLIALIFVIVCLLGSCDGGQNGGQNNGQNDHQNGNQNNDQGGNNDQPEPEHTHTFGKWTTVTEATCTAKGLSERSCPCGEKETEAIPMVAHTEVVDTAIEPTQNRVGLTEGKHCSVCGFVLVEQTIIPSLDSYYHSITYKIAYGNTKETKYETYDERIGLLDLLDISVPGYEFNGWFNNSKYETVVDYISKGETEDIVLFAKLIPIKYNITYENAPQNNNFQEYNIETRTFELNDPIWSGLSFAYWTNEEGIIVTQIDQGSIGDITLTAHWRSQENIAISSADENRLVSALYDESLGTYYFVYELGKIHNVVLETYESVIKQASQPISWQRSKEFSIENNIADTVATTVGQSISHTQGWTKARDDAEHYSDSSNWNISGGGGLDFGKIKANFEGSYGESTSNETTLKQSTINDFSSSTDQNSENSFSSAVSWASTASTTLQLTMDVPGDMPAGNYTIASVGTVSVYVIVTYSPLDESYHLDTYSVLENKYSSITLYEVLAEDKQKVDIVENEPLSFSISISELDIYITSSKYEVQYDANGGDGEMPTTVFYRGINQPLYPNNFTKEGYTFSGWKYQDDENVIDYQDEQIVCDLAVEDETVVLQAIWAANPYTVTLDVAGGNALSPSTHSVTFNEKYGKNGALPTPTRAGYDFSGWYNGNELIDDDSFVATAADHTLTARWIPQTYKITFNGNGGIVSQLTKEVPYASTYGELPTATREGYIFDGWFTAFSGGIEITQDSATASEGESSNFTLYAHWTQITYKLYLYAYDCNAIYTVTYGQSYTYNLWEFASSKYFDCGGWYYCSSYDDCSCVAMGYFDYAAGEIVKITDNAIVTITITDQIPIYDGKIYLAGSAI